MASPTFCLEAPTRVWNGISLAFHVRVSRTKEKKRFGIGTGPHTLILFANQISGWADFKQKNIYIYILPIELAPSSNFPLKTSKPYRLLKPFESYLLAPLRGGRHSSRQFHPFFKHS